MEPSAGKVRLGEIENRGRRKRESEGVYSGVAEEGIYLAIKVTTNSASILCRKEGWKEIDSARLQVFE